MQKLCKQCNELKPFNKNIFKPQSKSVGFVGKLCWSCYLIEQRARREDQRASHLIHSVPHKS